MARLELRAIGKSYGSMVVIDDLCLVVEDGEFLTLVGPSGCGKSTTLAMIAGLERPSAGLMKVNEQVVSDANSTVFVPAERRGFGMVFQNYGLWPHLTISQNVEYPLKLRRIASSERRRRVDEVLSLVEMSGLAARLPSELSGGQQQRVALARALAYKPRVLLLDEPLSNLDAKLRERARVWLREIQRHLKLTTILVTHDQLEALSMSDRIAVMHRGRIRQVGSPLEIWQRPIEGFVADFMGSSNLLAGTVMSNDEEGMKIKLDNGPFLSADARGFEIGQKIIVAIRPERIEWAKPHDRINTFPIVGKSETYFGTHVQTVVQLDGISLRMNGPAASSTGAAAIQIRRDACHVMPQGALDADSLDL